MNLPDSKSLSVGVSSLSGLLWLIVNSQSWLHKQSWLVYLAVSGEFVQRLWFSYLRMTWREALEGSELCKGSQEIVPLLVFCQVYSCFLVTAGLEEVCQRQEPLPLKELYDSANPSGGVIPMLRQAMWQAC